MVKRLKRLASITLQHATTLEGFLSICKDGAIKPYNDTNKSRTSNSLDPDSVYLSSNNGQEFAYDMISHSDYGIGLYMKLSVNESNLLPSYDFKEFSFPEVDDETGEEYYVDSDGNKINDEDELTWKDTLSINDECRYKGPIPISDIVSVTFFTDNNQYDQYKNMFHKGMSFNEAEDFADKLIK